MTAADGAFNQVLKLLGREEPIIFFTEMEYFRTMYIASGIWQEIGFSSILFLAAIAGIDPTLLDVAEVDGAGRFRRILHITLPSILPTIIILLIFRMGDMLNVSFEKVLLMYNPAIYEVADVINTYVYREGIERTMYDYTTAVGLFNSVVSFLLIFLANKFSRRVSEISLW
jgi:putative aldouronate transport system permease protein